MPQPGIGHALLRSLMRKGVEEDFDSAVRELIDAGYDRETIEDLLGDILEEIAEEE